MNKEQQIEEKHINQLKELKYNYRPDIKDRNSLEQNFREKFEALNNVSLSDKEFLRLMNEIITPDVFAASKLLRQQNYFQRDDGTSLHYTLINIKDWCKNDYEVINQLRINTKNSNHRYDVVLLINGLPVVQIELKSNKNSSSEAMKQIVNYKKDPGNGYTNSLMCFIQLFIVSNSNRTLYFANNKDEHFAFDVDEKFLPVYQLADENNNKINFLEDFTDKFLKKCTLGEMISKYMVLVESEKKLLVMRPYQIYAVQAIDNCVNQNRGNGYIWHTTGSGKTLTSFKASILLKDNPDIEKCLFVVDRKDLDRQTRDEFNKFQEGCVEENTNTETLVRRLLSNDYANKVIVTTIQKLGLALDPNNKKNFKKLLEPLRYKRMVFIFDECHRSQFGENHKAIKEFFPNAQLFGFTGTPIFEENATYNIREGKYASYKTTKDIFQKQLHAYTITNAIEDENVLRFHVDYYKPLTNPTDAYNASKKTLKNQTITKKAIVEAILQKHDAATKSRRFNALFATSSINDAIEFYDLFKEIQNKKQNQNPDYVPLNIACVFSPPAEGNKDIMQIQEDLFQEKEDNNQNPDEKKAALTKIINDYNAQYGTNFTIFDFYSYYHDIQKRIKDHQYSNNDYPHKNKIDITIVVDMLLTGFDSKYLNTLYVDKNLSYHGLIQAFSRTNRVLNKTKPFGNIIDFCLQKAEVDKAVTLFSGLSVTERAKEIWLVEPANVVIDKFQKAVNAMEKWMEDKNLVAEPHEVYNIKGDAARVDFINRFKEVQSLKIHLDQYTDLNEEQKAFIEQLMPKEQLLSFRSSYLEIAKQLKLQKKQGDNAPENIQQVDFEFVLFASDIVDYDYIIKLIAQYTQPSTQKQKMTRQQLIDLLRSSAELMYEFDDLTDYINSLEVDKPLNEQQVKEGYQAFKEQKIAKNISEIAQRQGLDENELKNLIDETIDRMNFDAEKLTDLLSPLGLGWKERSHKETALMNDLVPLLKKLAQGREISGLNAYTV